jgi:hypothetical protein
LFKQMLSMQTKEGFWEDGRHHGPSARYCGLMLPSLAWMYRWTQDNDFLNAARKLVDFMTTYVYPDTVTVGPFDGRNSNVLAYFPICPGFELTSKGRAYNLRAFRFWKEMGMLEDVSKASLSTRDLPRLAFYTADTCVYLDKYAPKANMIFEDNFLPVESEGTLENHSTEFDGVMLKKGRWILSLSGQNSDVRGFGRLERESRIEIWHEKGGVICGGGHHRMDWRIPFANTIIDSGLLGQTHFGEPAESKMEVVPWTYYKARKAESKLTESGGRLKLVFGHGTIIFSIHFPDDQKAVIEATWETRYVKRLCLQIPLLVWFGGKVWLDGLSLDVKQYALRDIKREVRIQGLRKREFVLHIPDGVPTKVHYPLKTGQFHQGIENHRKISNIDNPFEILLVSSQWDNPAAKGNVKYTITI